MTLYRQLLIYISILIAVLFTATMIAKVQITRDFLESQLESHAQDTATSLGLSISGYLGDGDMATVDTMMNAIFDGGYYRSIELVDITGKALITKELGIVIDQVPGWFIDVVPLVPPRAEVLVSAGWQRVGYLRVVCHPGYAYQSLWMMLISVARIFLTTGLIAAIIGIPILRILFQPLVNVVQQAEGLCNRHYRIQEKLPKTSELRHVVTAMNSMVEKVRAMFDEQSKLVLNLGKKVYEDSLTGLGNRRYLLGVMNCTLRTRGRHQKGAFMIIETADLAELNQQKGYETGDLLLQHIAEVILQACSLSTEFIAARISGGTFSVFLPDIEYKDAEEAAKTILRELTGLVRTQLGISDNIGHIGGIWYSTEVTEEELFAEADRVLRKSQHLGPNRWLIEKRGKGGQSPAGMQQWKELLTRAISDGQCHMTFQKVVSSDDPSTVIQIEACMRIRDAHGNTINAGSFIPQAEILGMTAPFDRIAWAQVLRLTAEEAGCGEVALNVSLASLKDEGFIAEIVSDLQKRDAGMPAVIFEFAEYLAIANLELMRKFKERIQPFRAGVGIDRFGRSYQHFGYLKSLHPKYVKFDEGITGSQAKSEDEDGDTLFFVQAMSSAAHSLDIMAIVKGIESKEQFDDFREMNIDGLQGYFIDMPQESQKSR